jgi:hypothetical protein
MGFFTCCNPPIFVMEKFKQIKCSRVIPYQSNKN